ncbi:MAG: transposase, partial [Treponema sp.]|nr:transposase [Treponema sp.]
KKRYWGQHLWGRGYFCATVGTVTQEMIKEYIKNQYEHGDKNNFRIEEEGG